MAKIVFSPEILEYLQHMNQDFMNDLLKKWQSYNILQGDGNEKASWYQEEKPNGLNDLYADFVTIDEFPSMKAVAEKEILQKEEAIGALWGLGRLLAGLGKPTDSILSDTQMERIRWRMRDYGAIVGRKIIDIKEVTHG